MDHDNPWGMPPRMLEALALYVETGSQKVAAAQMGISVKTLEVHIFRAKKKMNVTSRVHVLLAFDRWHRDVRATLREESAHAGL